MKIGDVYVSEGKSLKAEDLKGRSVELTIAGYEQVQFKNDKPKIVLTFRGKEKGLVLNITNAKTIAANLGSDEIDDWVGQSIIIYPTTTDFSGKMVPCIRVKEDIPPPLGSDDDSIPF